MRGSKLATVAAAVKYRHSSNRDACQFCYMHVPFVAHMLDAEWGDNGFIRLRALGLKVEVLKQ
ncbi:hypothetical protein [Corallococcus sp. M7]